jgi:hypothetical protein
MNTTTKLIFLLVVLVALICLAVVLIPPVSAGGYAPLPVDPYEHQTALEAQQIAGAAVDFRGTYSTPAVSYTYYRHTSMPDPMPGPFSDPTVYYYTPGPWNDYVAPIPGPWNT